MVKTGGTTAAGSLEKGQLWRAPDWTCDGVGRVKGGARRIGASYLWLPDDADLSSGDKAGSAEPTLGLQFTPHDHAAIRERR